MANIHFTHLTPDMDEAMLGNILDANMDAVSSNNDAYSAMRAGRLDEAIKLHKKALALKLRAYPESSTQVGVSLNGLGVALFRAGKLEEADNALEKALAIREQHGPALDAAATRENMAALREAQGRFDEAREMRLRGDKKGQMLCGNYDVVPHESDVHPGPA
ncbi:hypothetical protein F4775DRAFT_594363 [Biscogniauxia sp. FL1348]|nr:hypothetical protein F4775DRAFT_594363 [Biscogniauxia sp. FL1348]